MFRRRTSQGDSDFDAGTEPLSSAPEVAASSGNQLELQQSVAQAIALARQQSRRRYTSDPPKSDVPSGKPGQLAPLRTRVQQPAAIASAVPTPPTQLQQPQQTPLQGPIPRQRAPTSSEASRFSVFNNPLSSNSGNQQSAVAQGARQPAALGQQIAAADAATDATPSTAEGAKPGIAAVSIGTQQQVEAAGTLQQPADAVAARQAAPSNPLAAEPSPEVATGSPSNKHSALLASKALRFEVQPAADDSIEHASLDQQLLGAGQQDSATQQYIYDQDTGQLLRVGEGADTSRLARHYLEDWNTGEFFQMAEPRSGCLAWIRRKPSTAPAGWQDGLTAQEPSLMRSLAEFTDTMGSGMAAMGMFAQGMAGGLALLSLFMTYLQYVTAGREGFLAYYSVHAQMVNRAFFTLISLSLVSAASRLAYDQLGNFKPTFLRLRLADGLVLSLYLLAYLCNLIATPIDDQLTFEARRDITYWRLPLPQAFLNKVNLWQVLNLMRIVCCGIAWAIVCYRGNPFVMMMVFEARKQQEKEEGSGLGGGTSSAAAAAAAGGGLAAGRAALGGMGSSAAGDLRQQGMVNRFLTGEGSSTGYRISDGGGGDHNYGASHAGGACTVAGEGGGAGQMGAGVSSRAGIGSGRLVSVGGAAGARFNMPPVGG